MNRLFELLVIFQLKHWLADFPLQARCPYMLGKFKVKGWWLPLAAHAYVHATFTLTIIVAYGAFDLCWLAALDAGIHFVIDRIKAHPGGLGKLKPDQPLFWEVLGVDQMLHHLTHYLIIYMIIK